MCTRNVTLLLSESDGTPALYHYPRLVIVRWDNHRQAAFYPDPDHAESLSTHLDETGNVPDHLRAENIARFVKKYLSRPDSLIQQTQHF